MPGSSTTVVDLSRLPAPAIVELLDVGTIKAAMLAALAASGFTAFVESDPVYKVIELAAYREQLLRQAAQDAGLQLLVAYATGANLDALAAVFGVGRLTITPADATTGAPAVMEGDDALRARVVLAPESYSVAGPELAYVAHAKAASGDVLDASATSPAPGEVLVSVLAHAGDGTAPAALVAAVQAVVADPAIRPLGDLVTTAPAHIVGYQIAAQLSLFDGPDPDLVLAAAEASLAAYLAANRLLGRNHRRAGMIGALDVPGVENVVLPSPIADILCDPTQSAWPTAISVTRA